MPGLAIDNSVKGLSLSTTTARFIGTFRALDGAPRITRKVSACETDGAVTTANAKLATAALIKFLYVNVTCLSDHASFIGSFCPCFVEICPENRIIARINALSCGIAVDNLHHLTEMMPKGRPFQTKGSPLVILVMA